MTSSATTSRAIQALERCARELAEAERDMSFTPSFDDYHAAVAALGALPPEERARIPTGLEHPQANVRVEAATAIARLGLAEARPALERSLRDPDGSVRAESVRALARIAPADALSIVNDAGVDVSPYALGDAVDRAIEAHGLASFDAVVRSRIDPWDGGRSAWRRLYDLDRDACAKIFTARLAGGRIGWVLGVAAIVREKGGDWARDPFLALTRSSDARHQRAAAEVLHVLGGADAIDALLDVIAEGAGWSTWAATSALFAAGRETKTPVAARAIRAASGRADAQRSLMRELESAATLAWEQPSRAEIVSGVERGLAHEDEAVVASALRVARSLHAEELADAAVATCGHDKWFDSDLTKARLDLLATLGPHAVSAVGRAIERGLSASATERDRAITRVAAHTIGELGPTAREHVSVLVRALRERDDEIASSAAVSLGLIGGAEASEALLAAAPVKSPGVAYRVVQALVKLGDARVIGPAVAYLRPLIEGGRLTGPETAWMAGSCIDALGAFGGQEAIGVLRRALDHPDMRLRRDASTALGTAGGPEAVPWLEERARDPDGQVRRAAHAAIAAIGEAVRRRP